MSKIKNILNGKVLYLIGYDGDMIEAHPKKLIIKYFQSSTRNVIEEKFKHIDDLIEEMSSLGSLKEWELVDDTGGMK